ncbi:Abasic site processing protein [Gammaproteobacteria bacterium]
MCGRYTLTTGGAGLAVVFGLTEVPVLVPRYNIAPSQGVPVVRLTSGRRELAHLRWGLIPGWATDPTIGNRFINARAETIADKPTFRYALHRRRCLVLADGFYEWCAAQGNQRKKQPYLIRRADQGSFAIAGLWENWRSPTGAEIESCILITTTANPLVVPIHQRMPVILSEPECEQWLDPVIDRSDRLLALLRPYAGHNLVLFPIGPWVNHPSHDDPQCLQPLIG